MELGLIQLKASNDNNRLQRLAQEIQRAIEEFRFHRNELKKNLSAVQENLDSTKHGIKDFDNNMNFIKAKLERQKTLSNQLVGIMDDYLSRTS